MIILIIAILMLMSITGYLGARSRANDRVAQANARNAFEAERILWAATGQLSSDVAATLPDTEPTFHWVADTVPTNAVAKTVVVSVGSTAVTNDTVVVGVKASSGACFYIRNYAGDAMQYGRDAACASATNALVSGATSPAGGWKTSW